MRPAVWAPLPSQVDLVLADRTVAMSRDGRDWWRADVELDDGVDYGFSVDGSPPLPDPRSRSQPAGVHGLSRVVHSTPPETPWEGFDLASAVLYELHTGTFTSEGTFEGAIDRLDHLVELGIDAVNLMPVNQYSGKHGWGYDGVDLYAPHAAYGGPQGLAALVAACRARGLGIILDVVYNHLGPEGNYLSRFGPYFTDTYRTPWGEAVNLDGPDSDGVRSFIIDNAVMWLRDYGFDGLRIDAVHALYDQSATHILEELATAVDELDLGRPLYLIAESDLNDPRLVWPRDRGGYGLDATWSDDFHHALHALLTGERSGYYADFGSLSDLRALETVYVYNGRYSAHRRRRHGRPVTDAAGTNFLGYLQNHDQVGNRAQGDRIGHVADAAAQMMGAALVLTAPFVPMLFQGEEWAASTPFPYFSDHRDPDLGRAVSAGRREEFASFGWAPEDVPDPQDPATHHSAVLHWDEIDAAGHAAMLEWYRSLIDLRHSQPDLTDGRLDRVETVIDEEDGTLVMTRGRIVVAVNIGDVDRSVSLPSGTRLLLSSRAPEFAESGLSLPPRSVAILAVDRGQAQPEQREGT